ncbi:MAG TPA: DUF1080 domain-containing protein [Anaerohalosphaeraceae bacterium]|nr:DUF1080 domain-containing protein [Anaerohalosphaeraceae bacterium]
MKRLILLAAAGLLIWTAGCAKENNASEWTVLFDGTHVDAWRLLNGQDFPKTGWKIQDGLLAFEPDRQRSGDIITKDQFSDFELELEFKLTSGANSGIKYFVVESASSGNAGLGLEYQLLDDDRHPDAKAGIGGNRTLGSLYDLIAPAENKIVYPVGQWNTAKIVSVGSHVEHWLNGRKILEFERGSADFMNRIAQSKYKSIAGFGLAPAGHILLQDHGNAVYFRNIRIRTLQPR